MFDIYATITARFCEQMEKGIIPWERPWFGAADGAVSGSTGKPYSLINQMLLGLPGEWFTFNQCRALGAKVRKGEKSSMVVFWKTFTKKQFNSAGEEEEVTVPVLKYFNVFHESQIDNLPEKDARPAIEHIDPHTEAEHIAADYIIRSGVTLNRDALSSAAFYSPANDSITIPRIDQFDKQSEYYSTLFHEMVHSTGHASRLARISGKAAKGGEEYSKEELVAEIGAAALVNRCGLETASSFRNSTAYIQNWLTALRNDKKLLVSATGKAEKAVNLILGITREEAAA